MERSTKMAVLWDIGPYNLVEFYRRFRDATASISRASIITYRRDNRGSKQHPGKQLSSYFKEFMDETLIQISKFY